MECNETPAPFSDMASSDATTSDVSDMASSDGPTSDGSPSLVPEGLSPENITEVSSPAISSSTDNVNSTVQYVLPFRHNCGKPPSRYSPKWKIEDPNILLLTMCPLTGYPNHSRPLHINYPEITFIEM